MAQDLQKEARALIERTKRTSKKIDFTDRLPSQHQSKSFIISYTTSKENRQDNGRLL